MTRPLRGIYALAMGAVLPIAQAQLAFPIDSPRVVALSYAQFGANCPATAVTKWPLGRWMVLILVLASVWLAKTPMAFTPYVAKILLRSEVTMSRRNRQLGWGDGHGFEEVGFVEHCFSGMSIRRASYVI